MNIAIAYIKRVSTDGTQSPHFVRGKSRSAEHLIIYLGITDIWALRMT